MGGGDRRNLGHRPAALRARPRLVAADRIAVSLAITTGLILVVMLTALGSARRVPTGLAVASAIVGAFALVAYLPP
jgi:hypothetical protein